MLSDLKAISIKVNWYSLCQDRLQWTKLCNSKVWEVAHSRQPNICAANFHQRAMTFNFFCGRQFHRQGDLTCHRRFCKESRSVLRTPLSLNFSGRHQEACVCVVCVCSVCVCACVCTLVCPCWCHSCIRTSVFLNVSLCVLQVQIDETLQ